jgi:hypothetical protein
MERTGRRPSFITDIPVRSRAANPKGWTDAMHPLMTHELAKIKISEALEDARRERLASAARESRARTIDAVPFRDRVARLFGGLPTLIDRSRPAGA